MEPSAIDRSIAQTRNTGKSLAYTSYTLNSGESTDYGYGWGISNLYGSPTIAHGGGIHGFLTQAIFLPDEDVFVTIFSNCNCQSPDGLAQKIAAIEIGKYVSTESIVLSRRELEEYEGIYQVDDGKSKRTIKVKEDHLTTQRSGGEVFDIYPFEKDKFFFENSLTIFAFKRDDNEAVTSMEALRPNGKNDSAKLTDEKPVERMAIKVDAHTLQQYVGEYELMPGFTIVVTLEDGVLMTQATGQPKVKLFAETETNFFLKVEATLKTPIY